MIYTLYCAYSGPCFPACKIGRACALSMVVKSLFLPRRALTYTVKLNSRDPPRHFFSINLKNCLSLFNAKLAAEIPDTGT